MFCPDAMTTRGELTVSAAGSLLTARPVQERWQVLQPYLDAVLVAAQKSLSLDAMGIRLEPWQREVLRQETDGDRLGVGWPGLVAEGLAFRALCLGRFGSESMDGDVRHLPVAGAVEDFTEEAAVGLALMQELQWAIDLAIDAHDLQMARDATLFRNELGHSVGALRRVAGAATFDRAAMRARSLIRAVPEAGSIWEQLEDWEEDEQPRHRFPTIFRRDPRLGRIIFRQTVRPPRTKEIWLTASFLSAMWWLLMFGPSGAGQPADPPLVDGARFRHIEAFREASASPPTLYVKLDARSWTAMSPQDRFDTLREIARIAERAGYFGVHARVGGGAPAGRWLKGKGVQLYEASAAAARRG